MAKYKIKTNQFEGIEMNEIKDYKDLTPFQRFCVAHNYPCFERVETEIKVGDWVWFTYGGTNIEGSGNALIRIGKNKNVGFGHFGSWVDDYASIASRMSDFHRKATDDEVGQALIEEAERRGFEKGNFKCLADGIVWTGVKYGYSYNYDSDYLMLGAGVCYSNGRWAEIIEDEWEVDWHGISGISLLSSVESGLAHMCVKKGDKEITFQGMTPEQAEAIAEKLNELDR